MVNEAMKELKEPVVIQSGTTKLKVKGARQMAMFDYVEFVELVRKARVVVCQAGPAVISQSWENGKKPIVVPRLKKYGEHVSDHQVSYAKKLSQAGKIYLANDANDLKESLKQKQLGFNLKSEGKGELIKKLQEYLNDQ